ncbi:putative flagellar switch protein FliM [Oceaniovalibus guishaninsula JLT2003]|uniref:Putative flagellar switch protein FliM n=1 Tax=Oceaniovalibus guishaninsula JLT2003 TaxID=1231392 RepID=K2GSI2_9RHOB|nr:FliM/FliN family flagellar motor switch protein [Oceaniovalibus guishaninsula]EKE45531.1 putative flagellar switch protein FliM [Oceaniovalibus guishaninsula JLT2003]
MTDQSPLRRKIGEGRRADAPPPLSPERIWGRAVVHGLNDSIGLAAVAEDAATDRLFPAAAAALVVPGALAVLLDGPDGWGLAVLDPGFLAAVIEQQTMARVGTRPVDSRPVTALDAAMAADPLDRILAAQEVLAADLTGLEMRRGYRFATRIEDPREIGLRLAETAHRRVRIGLALGGGARHGHLDIVLPEPPPRSAPGLPPSNWPDRLQTRVMGAEVGLTARLASISLSAGEITDLRVGQVLTLPRSALGRVQVTTGIGEVVAEGRLGQSDGRKAVRIVGQATGEVSMDGEGG